MERSVAIKKLTKLLGKNLGWRINSKAPTPEERTAAKAELPSARAEHDRLKRLRDDHFQTILAADQEYQKLRAECEAAHKKSELLWSITLRHKFTVGTHNEMFFHVKAEGDSWEEVIDKVAAKEAVSNV